MPTLPKLDRNAVTVSGLSSGGFFAHQFHVAYSKLVNGAGIIAGGPYGCVENIPNPYWPWWPLDRLSAALVACTHFSGERFYGLRPSAPKAQDAIAFVQKARREADIDDPANLADDRVWIFRGTADNIVPNTTGRALHALYQALGIGGTRLHLEERPANHGMPVATFPQQSRFPKRSCDEHKPPFVIECGFDAAEQLLAHLYAGSFDAGAEGRAPERTPGRVRPERNSWPAATRERKHERRRLRLCADAMSGGSVPAARRVSRLRQNADSPHEDRIHDDFIRDAGYNSRAAANKLVILYPQATPSCGNPNADAGISGAIPAPIITVRKASRCGPVRAMVGAPARGAELTPLGRQIITGCRIGPSAKGPFLKP